jgi:tartrate dehydratase beta subunit/fumarate hydratase class I family protein
VIIGTTRFKTGFFYVNDCLVLEGYIANCREQSRGRVVKMVEVEELGLDERGRRVVSSFLAMMGGENVEMFESNEWFYIKGLSARNPIREAELCLRRRFTRI